MKNKKRLLILTIICSILFFAVACKGDDSKQESKNPSEENKVDENKDIEKDYEIEELKVGITKDIEPHSLVSEQGSFGRMNYNAFCAGTLMVRNLENEIEPNLMTDWELSEDGREIVATFATDKGIKWHDGQLFTIDDVIFTIDFMNNTLKSGYLSKVEEVEKLSDTKLKLKLKDASAYFTLGNSAVFVRIFPKHIWENIENPKEFSGLEATIGCGPYKLTKIDEEARVIYYEAVENWPLGKLKIKKVSVRTYDSQDALVMALNNGEVDAMNDYSNPISPTMLPSISNNKNLDPGKSINQGLFQILFGFNKAPTNDLAFRKAVRSALNYELLAMTIGGEDGQIPGEGIISPSSTGHDASLPKLKQDQALAKEILEGAGYKDIDGDGFRERPDGSQLDVLVTPQFNKTKSALYNRIAEILIQNLSEVGIKTTLDEESIRNADHEKKLRDEKAYEIYIGYSTQGVAYYKTAFLYMFHDPISMWGSCNIEEFNGAYNEMLTAKDLEDYKIKVKNLQKIVAENVIGIALCWDTAYYPYRIDKYENWSNYPGWGGINASTWYTLSVKE